MVKTGRIIDKTTEKEVEYIMRPADENDKKSVMQLQKKIMNDGGFDPQWFYAYDEGELDLILGGEGNMAAGIFIEDKMVAFRAGCLCGIEYEEITEALGEKYLNKPCFLMNGCFVDQTYRGHNFQQFLSEYSMDECAKVNVKTFIVTIHPDNRPSIKSFENLGFKSVKRQMLYGGTYDRLILVKEKNCQS